MASFRAVLAKLPVEDRTRFLEDMAFANGRLVNVRVDPLEETLAKREVEALMEDCGTTTLGFTCSGTAGDCIKLESHACDASACQGARGAAIFRLGELIEAAPPRARAQFLDSLDFKEGRLIYVDHHSLRGYLNEGAHAQLPRILPTR